MREWTDAQLRNAILAEAHRFGCELSNAQQQSLVHYCELLQRWNRAVRLVGRADSQTLVRVHLADSLALTGQLRAFTGDRVEAGKRRSLLDVGTGAGLPGIVVAIVCPELHASLCEVSSKRVSFLRTVIRSLGLDCPLLERDVSTLPPSQRRFDHVVSRAVFEPERWRRIASVVCAPRGVIWSMLTEKQRREGPRRLPPAAMEYNYQLADGRQRCLLREEPVPR